MKADTNLFKTLSKRLYNLLEAEKYSESTMRDMRFILHSMSNFMKTNCLEDYSPEIGERFVAHCINDLRICPSRISRAKNIVGKLNRLRQGLDGRDALLPDMSKKFELPDNLAKSLAAYLAYCAEKGNRKTTIRMHYLVCGNYLKNLADLGCTEISDATAEQVQAAFLAMGYICYWERVRPFLRFLADSNYLKQNYSGLIQHRSRPMPQPTVYSPEEVSIIEESFDLLSPAGIRNHAIMLLMSRYGIRACDVAALTLENIDFENNRLRFIQQKTGDPWEGELFPEVKSALQRYIDSIRPNTVSCSSIFITLAPPYVAADNNVINTMIWNQFGRASIDIAGRMHGGRAFRSSVASNMINDGVSTEVVRRVLGHGTKYALKHYARIDIETMRLCPLPVPEPAGIFANILSGKGVDSHV